MTYGGPVLESYSSRARHVVSLAITEARGLDHARVGTEHLLLGLLSDENGVPAVLLRNAGASLAAARHKVAEVVVADTGAAATEALPFTARGQRALERAGRYSRQRREPEVSTKSVLFGVLDVEGLACQVLRGLGADVGSLHDALVAASADATPEPEREQSSVKTARPRCPWCREALDGSLAEAVLATRGDLKATYVSVVYCTSCGSSLGVVRSASP